MAGGSVTLDVDATEGPVDVTQRPGMETAGLESITDGTAVVWVHHKDSAYDSSGVASTPAAVEIFCHDCSYEGVPMTGYVTTVTQVASDVPAVSKKWWRVGHFVAFNGYLHWESCAGEDCYAGDASDQSGVPPLPPPNPRIILCFLAEDAGQVPVSEVTYTVYKNYPAQYEGCTTSCGEQVAVGDSAYVLGGVDYLVTATHPDYFSSYHTETWSVPSSFTFTGLIQLRVGVAFVAADTATGAEVTGVSYSIYQDYPDDYEGCTPNCGTLVHSTTGTAVTLDGDFWYLVHAHVASGYYDSYWEQKWHIDATESIDTVREMAVGQNRLVLTWRHSADLDLTVVDGGDVSVKSNYENAGARLARIAHGSRTQPL
jgi:hypothetical protein